MPQATIQRTGILQVDYGVQILLGLLGLATAVIAFYIVLSNAPAPASSSS